MKVSVATAAQCNQLTVELLELDRSGHDLFSPEGLAASLRRAASFLCPATPRQLVDAVFESIQPLGSQTPVERRDLYSAVDSLISVGDLIEIPAGSERSTRLLFLGPPSYVEKSPGHYLLTGIRPYGAPLVGPDTDLVVVYDRHLRSIELNPPEAGDVFGAAGLHRIDRERWAAEPERLTAKEVVIRIRSRLGVANVAGVIPELTVIDPRARVTYYRGRWREVQQQDSGDFVGRRPQEYGNPLWCAVRIENGQLARLIDFPLEDVTMPGHDEAWRVQAAIDASRGTPQQYRLSPPIDGPAATTIDLFSPLPSWAQRYLDLTGVSVDASPGSLFSYELPTAVVDDVKQFLGQALWMSSTTVETTR